MAYGAFGEGRKRLLKRVGIGYLNGGVEGRTGWVPLGIWNEVQED